MECINKTELDRLENYLIIDVRTQEERAIKHIPNSLHIPLSELPQRLNELPFGQFYVTACGKGGGRSIDAAQLLQNENYSASWLCEGTLGWLES